MIHLKIAGAEHTPVVASLLADLFAEVEHEPTAGEIAASFLHVESREQHSTLLAWDGEVPVGILTLAEVPTLYAGGYIGVINELYVVPAYRSAGVGKMLLDAVVELAQRRDWRRLEVTTPGASYLQTQRFYLREGFHEIGPRYKKYV